MNTLFQNFIAAWKALLLLLPVFAFCALSVLSIALLYYKKIHFPFWRVGIICAVFSSFGATIGMFMGASSSPIVTSILPPIITLISGYLAVSAGKEFPIRTRVIIPGAVLVLLISLLFAAFYMKHWYLETGA